MNHPHKSIAGYTIRPIGIKPFESSFRTAPRLAALTRTTHSIAPDETGEQLINAIGQRPNEIENALIALSDRRDKPAGNLRRLIMSEWSAGVRAWIVPEDTVVKLLALEELGNVLVEALRYWSQ